MSLPYMQLYPADYLGDTRHLTTEQHGAYLLLLMIMWRAGGLLPDRPEVLARLAGLTPARWNKIKPEVMAFFHSADGFISQARLTIELQIAEEKSEKNSQSGKLGVKAKALKRLKTAQANASQTLKRNASPSEPEPELERKKGIDKSIPVGLSDQVWDAANKASRNRSGRPALARSITAAINKGASSESLIASVREHCRTGGDHAKGVHRIVEAELWREYIPKLVVSRELLPGEEQYRMDHYRATGEWRETWGQRPAVSA